MFSKYIGMMFGEFESAYLCIERGQKKLPLVVNNLTLREIDQEDRYRYLGIDESVRILGPLNKERVTKEYNERVKKSLKSELNGLNKTRAHNAFVVAVMEPRIAMLDWTKKEISDLDVKTKRLLTLAGAFRAASDVIGYREEE